MERTAIDVLLVLTVSLAACTDLARGKVYNTLTLPAIALGLALNGVFWGATGLWDSVQAGALAFAFLIIPVAMKGMGAGDLKLLVAIGTLGGVQFLVVAFFCAAIIGGTAAGAILAYRRLSALAFPLLAYRRLAFLSTPLYIGMDHSRMRAVPYAVAMALGCVIALYLR